MESIPLLPVLAGLPLGHPAAVYDTSVGDDNSFHPTWFNEAYDVLSHDGLLSLSVASKNELACIFSSYSHFSAGGASSVRLALDEGGNIQASLQMHDARWLILIGVHTPTESILSDMAKSNLTPVARELFNFNWAATSLGSMHLWPDSLKYTVAIMMANPFESCIFWGEDRTLLFNNAWAKGSAAKPGQMGKPGHIAFGEIWDTFSKHCDLVYSGQSLSSEDDLLFWDMQAPERTILEPMASYTMPKLLESYYSWSYVPVRNSNGSVGGILNNCIETTGKVIFERRMQTLRLLAELTGRVNTSAEFWQAVVSALRTNEYDFPYVLCYSNAVNFYDTDSSVEGSDARSESNKSDRSSSFRGGPISQLSLAAVIGTKEGHAVAAPSHVTITHSAAVDGTQWPLSLACTKSVPVRAQNPCPEEFERTGWGDIPGDGVVIPLSTSDGWLTGVVIFGLNTRRPYDDNYIGFHNTLVRNLSASLSATQSIEQELRHADEVRALDRAKTTFFQNVSHELRTPLTLIRGPCEDALKDEKQCLDPTNKARVKLIYRASARLLRLVNSLMLFSSAEAKRLQSHFSPVDLGPRTAEMASLFRSAIEKAGVAFNVTCGSPSDTRVAYVDIGMWEKIVFNLLSNAVKYTKQGFINLNVIFTSSEVIMSIHDSGCGIPEDQLEKVLIRFHRVDSSNGRSNEGTGIGLALTHELVKIHGGTIRVQSSLDKGSVFTVKLPLGYHHLPSKDVRHEAKVDKELGLYSQTIVEEATGWLGEDSDSASILSQPSTENVGGYTILLVEGNADARIYIKSILMNVAQDVVAVGDGHAALDYIHRKSRPDLIVTDITMPRMNGIQLLTALQNDEDHNVQSIPVIVLSTLGGSEAKERHDDGIFQGVVDFLPKPFSSADLIARVQGRLQSIRQRNELERQVRERTMELRVTKQRYQRMSELSPVAIFETEEADRDVITYANERFFALVGMARTLPLDFSDVLRRLAPDNHSMAQLAWREATKNGKDIHFDFVFANGKNTFVEVICLSDGRLLGTLTDQTEQRRFAADQLNSERAKADEAVHQRRLQEAFIDIVSHELRNPLSAIIQSADLLAGSITRLQDILKTFKKMIDSVEASQLFNESQVELEDASHAVSSVSLCARHQTIIASDILAVSRLDSNLLNINPVSFYLQDELNATIAMYSVQAIAQGIDLSLKTGPEIGPDTCILADPTRFCQIMVNLISNSCRILESWDGVRRITVDVTLSSMRPFGPVVTEPQDDGSRIWLVVRLADSGPGIPLDDQARLFTRFNDVNSGNGTRRASSIGGTGLGLYLCKKLAELQGGQIRHAIAPREGAAFHFFIEARRVVASGVRRVFPHIPTIGVSTLPTPRISPGQLNDELGIQGAAGTSPSPLSSSINNAVRSSMLVLVVEDNVINQRLLRRQLEKAMFQVGTANNGLEALQFLEAHAADKEKLYPTVVLMDLEMPVLDGLDAARRVREWEMQGKLPSPPISIFAITGNARQGQVDAALNAGMDRVFIKPYQLKEIVQQIDLEGSQLQGNILTPNV